MYFIIRIAAFFLHLCVCVAIDNRLSVKRRQGKYKVEFPYTILVFYGLLLNNLFSNNDPL